MKHVLIISGVDLVLLEKQRKQLVELEASLPEDYENLKALRGVIEMLDTWSDKQYFDK